MIGRVHDSGGRAQNGKSPATLEILSLNGKYLFLDMPKIRRFEAFDNTDGLNRGSIVKYHWENNVLKLKPDNGYAFSLFLHFVVISLIVATVMFFSGGSFGNPSLINTAAPANCCAEIVFASLFVMILVFIAGTRNLIHSCSLYGVWDSGLGTGLKYGFLISIGMCCLGSDSFDILCILYPTIKFAVIGGFIGRVLQRQ